MRSAIEGYGVVATRRFKKGAVVANVEGVLWRAEERRDDTYSLILDDGLFFDMVDQTRWVNHSCDPNIIVEAGVTRLGNGWAQLQALKDIAPGDELTFDYGFAPELAVPCRCGAKRCRGWIIDANAPVPPRAALSAGRARVVRTAARWPGNGAGRPRDARR